MLFALPPVLVPIAVVAGLAGAAVIGHIRDTQREERPMVIAASGWQAVGPAAVFALADVTRPEPSAIPIYLLAFVAQFAVDAGVSWVRNCYGLGVPTRQLANALKFTFVCDLTLAPIGFAAVLAVPDAPGALLFLLPPTFLLAMLQADRHKQVDHLIALGTAFQQTRDLARRDALTGLSNRLAWEENIEQLGHASTPTAVILADVDGLKVANDTHGHDMGDRLLVTVATLLTHAVPAVRGADVFRIGGDEFAILLPRCTIDQLNAVATTLRASFAAATPLDGVVHPRASVGTGFATSGAQLLAAVVQADRRVNADKTARGARRA
jgi:diguanylate cyclase (GGDEF)-like protein